MKIELEQNTEEWEEYRSDPTRRNASEAGVVMGVSTFLTKFDLWQQKRTGVSTFTGNIATEWGHTHEAAALDAVSGLLGLDLMPAIYQKGDYSASLDGCGEYNDITYHVEVKCPFQKDRSKLWAQVKSDGFDRIPAQYYCQMLHQRYCLDLPNVQSYLFVYIPPVNGNEADYELVPFIENQGDTEKLLEAWDDFYENPPVIEVKTPESDMLVSELESLKATELEVKNRRAVVEGEIKALAGDRAALISGYKVAWVERKGVVDYSKIEALKGVNLESYRKVGSKYQKISKQEK